MLKVALTGGIGSGKTTVSRIFEHIYHIPIYSADEHAKLLMEQDENIKSQLLDIMGNESYMNQQLNRPYLANILFHNIEIKTKIDNLVHTAVIHDYLQWSEQPLNVPYYLHEAALVFEAKMEHLFDKIIVVYSPMEIKIQRLLKKGMTLNDIRARMNAQIPDEEKIKKADFIITNNEQESLIEQVIVIHKQLNNCPDIH